MPEKDKILIFSTAYHPFVGGAEIAIKEITDRIPGVKFDLITAKLKPNLPKREKIGNVHVFRLGFGISTLDKLLLPFSGALLALYLNSKNKYKYFWCMMASYSSGAAYIANIIKFWKPTPIVLALQEGDSEEYFRTKWFGLINLSWKLALRRTSSLTVLSAHLRDRARRFGYQGEINIVSNGVHIESFTREITEEERNDVRQELGLNKGDIALVTTSRLVVKNGIADAIKALPLLPSNFKFVVIGEGNLKESLEKLSEDLNLKDRVVFKGFIQQEKLPKYIKSCDIFVRPSLSEGFGNSFIESFAARVPVVATRVGGIADFLEDGVTGYVCEPENPKSVAKAIERCVSDPEKNKVIENSFNLATKKYGWKNIALAMKRIFDIKIRVAVVGGGIFGSSSAIRLAQSDLEVSLFEKEKGLLQAASGINQYRLHRGYHYPRSLSTALSSKSSEESFLKEYGEAVIHDVAHYYCIAKEKSKITGEDFIEFCEKCGLEYEKVSLDCLDQSKIDLSIKGKESLINPIKLREIVNDKLNYSGVKLLLDNSFDPKKEKSFDFIINCTYASLNSISKNLEKNYQFEVCEKPVLKLPKIFNKKSIVILDGPFMCIDPYGDTDMHVMGNVVHAIHATNTGLSPIVPEEIKPLLNKGIVKNPRVTNIEKFIESASYFMPEISKAEHVGSMFTVRTVLPNVDATDERPTIVSRVGEDIINVFSGKIGNCMEAADQVLNLIKNN